MAKQKSATSRTNGHKSKSAPSKVVTKGRTNGATRKSTTVKKVVTKGRTNGYSRKKG